LANCRHGLATSLRGTVITSISAWSGCEDNSIPGRKDSAIRLFIRFTRCAITFRRLPFCVREAIKTDKHIPTLWPPLKTAAQVHHRREDSGAQRQNYLPHSGTRRESVGHRQQFCATLHGRWPAATPHCPCHVPVVAGQFSSPPQTRSHLLL